MIKKLYAYLYKASVIRVIVLAVLASLLSSIIILSSYSLLGGDSGSISEGYDITFSQFLLIVVIAPFIETVFLQYFPLKLSGYAFERKKTVVFWTIIPLSMFFGILHFESKIYMVSAFSFGLIWTFCCLLFIRRKQNPVLFTSLIHSCYNGILFSLTWLLDI